MVARTSGMFYCFATKHLLRFRAAEGYWEFIGRFVYRPSRERRAAFYESRARFLFAPIVSDRYFWASAAPTPSVIQLSSPNLVFPLPCFGKGVGRPRRISPSMFCVNFAKVSIVAVGFIFRRFRGDRQIFFAIEVDRRRPFTSNVPDQNPSVSRRWSK